MSYNYRHYGHTVKKLEPADGIAVVEMITHDCDKTWQPAALDLKATLQELEKQELENEV